MRVAIHNVNQPFEAALRSHLPSVGHTLVAPGEANAIVAGTGTLTQAAVLDVAAQDWSAMIDAVRSAFLAARDLAAAVLAERQEGRIVFVVDPPCKRPLEGAVGTSVAGGFLTTLGEVAAAELGSRGVTANILIAGWSAPAPAALAGGIPVGRLATPQDLAGACAYLLSPEASYVNGASLAVDGGYAVTKAAHGPNPLQGSRP